MRINASQFVANAENGRRTDRTRRTVFPLLPFVRVMLIPTTNLSGAVARYVGVKINSEDQICRRETNSEVYATKSSLAQHGSLVYDKPYLSTSSPPVEAGALKPTLRVLPSTASRVTFDGGSLGCGMGIAKGVTANAGGPIHRYIHAISRPC